MFADYVYEKSAAKYADKILLIDADHLAEDTRFTDGFKARGFEIVVYHDDLSFRIEYEEKIKSREGRIAVVVTPDQYVPYDLRRRMTAYKVSLADLFPRLNTAVLRESDSATYDLVSSAYERTYDQYQTSAATEQFLRVQAYSKENVRGNLDSSFQELLRRSEGCTSYREWFAIAEEKARIDCMAVQYDLAMDTTEINLRFRDYILSQYGKLSTSMDRESPVLVSKAMEFMHEHSKKFIIIVMDGMSEFDWRILSRSFNSIHYRQTAAFAMIPTVTSVSRQCLLSNKYPRELVNPWSQSKEKQEFIDCAKNLGFADTQIEWKESELENDDLKNYKAKAEYYVRQHQDNAVIQKLKSNVPLTGEDVKVLEGILWSEVGTKQEYEAEYGAKPLGEFVREIVGLDMNAAKAAFASFLNDTNLDSRQIYFVNQIVEYIVHNGMMKDLSVLQEPPFTDQGSIVEVFTDLTVWLGIRRAIEQVNANAAA